MWSPVRTTSIKVYHQFKIYIGHRWFELSGRHPKNHRFKRTKLYGSEQPVKIDAAIKQVNQSISGFGIIIYTAFRKLLFEADEEISARRIRGDCNVDGWRSVQRCVWRVYQKRN